MRFSLPQLIHHDYASFEALACLHEETKEYILDSVLIDMKATRWFDADMCAAFGAILYSLQRRLNEVNLIQFQRDIETILSKNGFLSHYGRVKIPDEYGTTMYCHRKLGPPLKTRLCYTNNLL